MQKLKRLSTAFLSLIFFYAPSAYAQNYVEFDFESSAWLEDYYHLSTTREEYKYTTEEAIVIGGMTYHRLKKEGRATNNGINWYQLNGYEGAIRQNDNKQVFYLPSGETEESLLYDFNIDLGDTIPLYDGNYFEVGYHGIVTEVDSVYMCGQYRKRFEIELMEDYLLTPLYWIEGVGSSHGLIPKYNIFESGIDGIGCFSDSNCPPCTLPSNYSPPYSRTYCYSFYGAEGAVYNADITRIGDTIIQGRSCMIMDYPFEYDIRYLWYDESRIYRYSREEDAFFLLYDFDLLPGEILSIDMGYHPYWSGGEDETLQFLITDVSYQEWNGEILRIQHIEKITDPGGLFTFGDRLIEGIGSAEYFVPYSQGDEIWAKLNRATFEESGLTYETNACTSNATQEGLIEHLIIEAVPNPFWNGFSIELPDQENGVGESYTLTLYDLLGQRLIDRNYKSGETVNLSQLENGLYLLYLSNKKGLIGMNKIVKN